MKPFARISPHLREGSPEYKAAVKKIYEQRKQAAKSEIRRHRMALRIIELCGPVQHLRASKLNVMDEKKLIAIGTAAKQLYDTLLETGFISIPTPARPWSEESC